MTPDTGYAMVEHDEIEIVFDYTRLEDGFIPSILKWIFDKKDNNTNGNTNMNNQEQILTAVPSQHTNLTNPNLATILPLRHVPSRKDNTNPNLATRPPLRQDKTKQI